MGIFVLGSSFVVTFWLAWIASLGSNLFSGARWQVIVGSDVGV